MNQGEKPKSGKSLKEILIVAGAAALGAVLVMRLMGGGSVGAEQALIDASNQMNATCPLVIDEATRLDSTAAGPGKRFTYLYTITSDDLESIIDPTFLADMRLNLTNSIRTSSDMKYMREQEVTLVYIYRNEDGEELARLEFGPEDYK